MTLEATIVILDNTEYSRNGDHLPSRYEAQTETIQQIVNAKQQMNIENAIGIMTMGGPQVDVLITPSSDPEAILGCLFGVKLRGDRSHFLNALQIAQLALKHRKNKNMRQRIIVFIASPICEDEKSMDRVAKQLKKNNLSVDIINMCPSGDNQVEKLEKFVATLNSGGSSHFLNAQSGIVSLNETLFNSPILNSFMDQNSGAQTGVSHEPTSVLNPFAEYGGIDPSVDPELAQVIKLSLEEEKRRLEQEERERAQAAQPPIVADVPDRAAAPVAGLDNLTGEPQQMLDNSMQEEHQQLLNQDVEEFSEMDEESLMAQAILASQQENIFEPTTKPKENKDSEQTLQKKKEEEEQLQANLMQDEKFVEDLLNLVAKPDEEEKKKESKKDDKNNN